MSAQGSKERRHWGDSTGDSGDQDIAGLTDEEAGWRVKNNDRVDRRIGSYVAASYYRGHCVPLCDLRRSLQGFRALEQPQGEGGECLLQERF